MSETFGQKLRQARQARSLSLEEVAQATYMRVHYLRALEEGELDSLPSLTQARGFLRAYADYLGLDADELLHEISSERITEQPGSVRLPGRNTSGLSRTQVRDMTPAEQAGEPVAPHPPPPHPARRDLSEEQVEEIFREIGAKLRRQRELSGLSLQDVENHTHMRFHNLQAIEAGAIDDLASPVQARGMLGNYARFVGLDPEPLLLKFAEALQVRLAYRRSKTGKSKRGAKSHRNSGVVAMPSIWRRLITPETMVSAFFTVALVAFLIWGVARILEELSTETPLPTAPSIAEVLLATPTITETFTPLPPSATLPPPPELANQPTLALTPLGLAAPLASSQPDCTQAAGGCLAGTPSTDMVQLYITVNQRAWMRVSVDGKVEFQGRVLAGSAYQFGGKTQVEVLTGNAAALEIFFHGQDLGPMGNFGQVVDRVYTAAGVLVPTPTITPTPTQTPLPSPTPRQTGTPVNAPLP